MYDRAFYDEQGEPSIRSASLIIPFLRGYLPDVKSVVDVGCGTGGWLSQWAILGAEICGIDGNSLQQEELKIPAANFIRHDLVRSLPALNRKFSLCMSLEVAEHLPKERAGGFVADICSYSDLVLFGAAIPGQTGVGHVNEQWQSHWAAIFAENGYRCFDIVRSSFWRNADVAWWYPQNILLFCNSSDETMCGRLREIDRELSLKALDVVHPELLGMRLLIESDLQSRIGNLERKRKRIRKFLAGLFRNK